MQGMQKFQVDRSRYDNFTKIKNKYVSDPGLSEAVVRHISESKSEPEWMLKKRLQGFTLFQEKPMPSWGPSLSALDLNKITGNELIEECMCGEQAFRACPRTALCMITEDMVKGKVYCCDKQLKSKEECDKDLKGLQ